MKVSFDFDSTLDRSDVQDYAKELIDRGIEVWVITSRPDVYQNHWIVDGVKVKLQNLDLYEVSDRLGISRDHVHFTCYELKSEFISGKDFTWHLDDDTVELMAILELKEKCHPFNVDHMSWKENCEDILNKV
jgi:hypothetical protein